MRTTSKAICVFLFDKLFDKNGGWCSEGASPAIFMDLLNGKVDLAKGRSSIPEVVEDSIPHPP